MVNSATQIWIHSEEENTYQVSLLLSLTEIFENQARLMTVKEFEQQDRSEGSIFDALCPGEEVELKEGFYVLNKNLDLIKCDQDAYLYRKLDQPMTKKEHDEMMNFYYQEEAIAREQDRLQDQLEAMDIL